MRLLLMSAGVALLLVVSCAAPEVARATTPDTSADVSISFGGEFATGRYGTETTTRSFYLPLIVTWFPHDRLDISIEVPFIYQNNTNVTTDLYRTPQTTTAATIVARRGGPGGSGGSTTQQSGTGTLSSGSADAAVSGVGDSILRFGVIALFEGALLPQLRPSVFVKLPTASAADGLGTGEFDAGVGVEVIKWFGDAQLIGEASYTHQGKVDGFGLQNFVSYLVSAGYQLTEEFKPMLQLKGATAPSHYSGQLLEARVRGVWAVTSATSLDLFVARGIADNSPEYGGGIAVVYSF